MNPAIIHSNRSVLLAGFLALGLAGVLSAAGAETANKSAGTDYSAFRLIADRNIFNPDRYAHSTRGSRQTKAHAPALPAFYLVGTMDYRKGIFAFFDGNNSEYRKVAGKGGTVAGYAVTEITHAGVKLEAGGKTLELKVGARMQQDGEGKWELSETGSSAEAATVAPAPAASDASAAPASDSSATSDILKRLMQKREQETK
jgi:hypothetical protein